jgi:hypothetical protein
MSIKRGRFGPVLKRRGRALLVELAAVEAAAGAAFTPAQLAAAGITVQHQSEEAPHGDDPARH